MLQLPLTRNYRLSAPAHTAHKHHPDRERPSPQVGLVGLFLRAAPAFNPVQALRAGLAIKVAWVSADPLVPTTHFARLLIHYKDRPQ